MKFPSAFVLGCMLWIPVAHGVPAVELEVEGHAWWAHVEKLGADDMDGRFTGTPGYQRAADYVAQRFASYGLSPAGPMATFRPSISWARRWRVSGRV